MKKLVSICLLVFFAFSVSAQKQSPLNQEQLNLALVKAKNMKGTGAVCTVIGAVATVTGFVMLSNSKRVYDPLFPNNIWYSHVDYEGGGVFLVGIGLLATGIPFWAIGGTKESHIEIALAGLKGSASINGIGFKVIF
jgi:hypothetical protein